MSRDRTSRLLVFRLGTELFGVDLPLVTEVIDAPVPKPIPDAPASVRGLLSLKGELITLYDLESVLEVKPRTMQAALVLTRNGRRVAVAIDDVFGTMAFEDDMLRSPPGNTGHDGVVTAVVLRGRHLVAVLDPEALLDALMAPAAGERT